MFNKYYQDELSFLRDMGKEFARAHPDAAHFLVGHGSDPDVERLLEGFAFLTGRIRQKLDDELPEVTHMLMGLLWPHYLRPIPSMSILKFEPIPNILSDHRRIPRDTEIDSLPVEGTTCRFRTCYDVDIYPLSLKEVVLETPTARHPRLRLRFNLSKGVKLANIHLDRLRLYLHGESVVSYTLYLYLCRYVKKVILGSVPEREPGQEIILNPAVLQPAGFHEEEALLPYPRNSFKGYRFLQEYFALAHKFLFIDIKELSRLIELDIEDTFEIIFEFSKALDQSIRIEKENILLNCTPVVNLFQHDSDPINVEHDKVEYRVRPAGADPQHYEIFSVDRVTGWEEGTSEERIYEPFYSFGQRYSSTENRNIFYRTRLHHAVVGDGTDTYISFVNEEEAGVMPPNETIGIKLTCTNRNLPRQLRIGEINIPTSASPEYARFSNITPVSASIAPPIGKDLYWRLISHLSINYQSLSNVDVLRNVLGLYNFQAIYDRQAARANELRLEGIVSVKVIPDEHLFHGAPIRGMAIEIELQEENFAGEGDMYLFASILNDFFALYTSLNSFSRLTVKGIQYGEIYQWQPRIGQQVMF